MKRIKSSDIFDISSKRNVEQKEEGKTGAVGVLEAACQISSLGGGGGGGGGGGHT